jgi:hypothetical protein
MEESSGSQHTKMRDKKENAVYRAYLHDGIVVGAEEEGNGVPRLEFSVESTVDS